MQKSKKFRLALTAADITLAKWARERNISRQFLYAVLRGKKRSQRVEEMIDRFIRTQLRRLFS